MLILYEAIAYFTCNAKVHVVACLDDDAFIAD